jgi:hypothetical protein
MRCIDKMMKWTSSPAPVCRTAAALAPVVEFMGQAAKGHARIAT